MFAMMIQFRHIPLILKEPIIGNLFSPAGAFSDRISKPEFVTESDLKGPNFLVAGSMKCGSSTLHQLLAQHPDIFMTEKKEQRYFSSEPWRRVSVDEYQEHFREGQKHKFRGESTPKYIATKRAVPLIHAYNPDMKLVIIVRDPVTRILSHIHYTYRKIHKMESSDIKLEHVLYELNRNGWWYRFLRPMNLTHYCRGRYVDHLDRVVRYFPRSNVKIVRFEDMIENPLSVANDVFAFLGADTLNDLEPVHENRGLYDFDLPQKMIDDVAKFYCPLNIKLNKKYGVSLNGWTMPKDA